MDYLVKIRSVQTPLNGQFSIGATSIGRRILIDDVRFFEWLASQNRVA
jgi:hypothetical protein